MNHFRSVMTFPHAILLMAILLTHAAHAQDRADDGGIAGGVPVGNAFTYRGELNQSGNPFSGTAEFHFRLYDAATGGAQVGPTLLFEGGNGVIMSEGRFTLQLDFGASVFAGDARWLEIDVRTTLGPFTTLTPRQRLTAAPYALYAVNGAGLALPYSASASSAGTDLLNITNTVGGGNSGRLGGVDAGAIGRHNATGNIGFVGHAGYGVFASAADATSIGVRGIHSPTGHDGELGDPIAGVLGQHLPTGNFGRLGTADYGVFGQVQASTGQAVYGENLSTGTNGRLGDGVAGVDGLATINNGRPGVRGYHLPTTNYGELGTAAQGVYGYGFETSAIVGQQSGGARGELGSLFGATFTQVGVYGIGAATGGHAGYFDGSVVVRGDLFCNPILGLAAAFDVQGNDKILSFRSSGVEQGSVSVAGSVVSYNAFTGSHFGWTDELIERGTLLSMTGVNRQSHDDPDAEVVYGIAPSTIANDSKCMGAFLSVQEPAKPASNENPHLVMAVGNGDMWVAESATGNIEPGEYLISSDVAGCAMKDDPQRFPVGYIVARAGEAVDWSAIDSPADGSAKRKKISVFFENFVRDSRGAELATIVEQQNRRLESLEAQVRSLQSIAERLAALERSQPDRAPVTAVSKSPSMAGGAR